MKSARPSRLERGPRARSGAKDPMHRCQFIPDKCPPRWHRREDHSTSATASCQQYSDARILRSGVRPSVIDAQAVSPCSVNTTRRAALTSIKPAIARLYSTSWSSKAPGPRDRSVRSASFCSIDSDKCNSRVAGISRPPCRVRPKSHSVHKVTVLRRSSVYPLRRNASVGPATTFRKTSELAPGGRGRRKDQHPAYDLPAA